MSPAGETPAAVPTVLRLRIGLARCRDPQQFARAMGNWAIAVCAPLLIVTAALLICSVITTGQDWGDDFSAYIMQARSLTEGTPFEFIAANRFTIEQSPFIGPVAYPWGFPALLAPVYALFGLNIVALKSVGIVCFLLFLCLLWRGFRKDHSPFWRLILVALFALNPTLLQFTNNILSDLPFLLVSTFAVLLIGRFVIAKRQLISPAFDQLFLGTVIAGAFFIRGNGILLLITLGFTQLVLLARAIYRLDRASPDQLTPFSRLLHQNLVKCLTINILPYVSFITLAAVWQALLPGGGSSYVSAQGSSLNALQLLLSEWSSIDVISYHAHYYFQLAALFFDGAPHTYILYGASIPLVVMGAISRWRSDYHIIFYVLTTFLLYVLWPPQLKNTGSYFLSPLALRFLFPILPFCMSFLVTSLEDYVLDVPAPNRFLKQIVCVLPIAVVLLYFGRQSASEGLANIRRNRVTSSGPFTETSMSMFAFIRNNTSVNSTIGFFKPRAMRLMTERRSLKIDEATDLLRADYLSFYEGNDDQISAATARCLTGTGTIRQEYKNRDFVVYRVIKSHKNIFDTPCTRPARVSEIPAMSGLAPDLPSSNELRVGMISQDRAATQT
jgi:hypothetical protein